MPNQRHQEKVSYYCTTAELMDLDQSVLELRRHGVRVDRGAVIRAAIGLALPEVLAEAEASQLYRSLTDKRSAGSGIPDPALFA
jgi:hypothetical protein